MGREGWGQRGRENGIREEKELEETERSKEAKKKKMLFFLSL